LVTAGCASSSSGNPEVAATKPPGNGAYVPNRRYETIATQESWTVNGNQVDVTLLVPAASGTYPLVLYMPGLGEPSEAGSTWRQAWARAGYAVLCVQPTQFGTAIWSSSRARAGDFSGIARDAYAGKSLAMRAQILQDAFAQVSRRQRGPAFAQIDLSRIAVAGFDLGAQTAQLVAGESVRGVEPLRFPDAVKGVIVLSPYADRASEESNFQSIHLPVLAVTSAHDADTYRLIASPSMRRTPFEYMPPGQKYLLLLASAAHGVLSGAGPAAPRDSEDTFTADDDKILGDETAEIQDGPRKRRRRPDYTAARTARLAQVARVQGQVQAVTTAYLDAVLRNDAAAAQWLKQNAKTWLGDSAELMTK